MFNIKVIVPLTYIIEQWWVVSVLSFYSNEPCSNPAEVYNFYSVNWFEKIQNEQNEAGDGPL